MSAPKSFVVPIYASDEQHRPISQVGSGVLATFGRAHFMLTAKHVIDMAKSRFIIATPSTNQVPLVGDLGHITPDSKVSDPDLAVVPISPTEAETIANNSRFINLGSDPILPAKYRSELVYRLIGYPDSMQDDDDLEAIRFRRLEMEIRGESKSLKHSSIPKERKDDFIALRYRRAFKSSNSEKFGGDFSCCSGGAVTFVDGVLEASLAGIVLRGEPGKNGDWIIYALGVNAVRAILTQITNSEQGRAPDASPSVSF